MPKDTALIYVLQIFNWMGKAVYFIYNGTKIKTQSEISPPLNKVITHKSRVEVFLVEQPTLNWLCVYNLFWPPQNLKKKSKKQFY